MAEENLHANHRARMQERVDRDGLDSLAEHEALEYLLFLSIPRADTNELAHRLINHFGDFCKVMEAEPDELMQVEGVGPKSARLIATVMAFGRPAPTLPAASWPTTIPPGWPSPPKPTA